MDVDQPETNDPMKTDSPKDGSQPEQEHSGGEDSLRNLGEYSSTLLSGSAALSAVLSRVSDRSAKEDLIRTPDEDVVNTALVNFLDALTCYSEDVEQLGWDSTREDLTVTLGKARIVAKTDGRLSPLVELRESQVSRKPQIFAIVEVKPFVLQAEADKTLMQMGIEMVAWIGQSISSRKEVRQFAMVSQHRHEVFLTFADFGEGYKRYLAGSDEDKDLGHMSPEESGFLTLHCYGPFDIFYFKHIYPLGRLIATLAVDANLQYRDWLRSIQESR